MRSLLIVCALACGCADVMSVEADAPSICASWDAVELAPASAGWAGDVEIDLAPPDAVDASVWLTSMRLTGSPVASVRAISVDAGARRLVEAEVRATDSVEVAGDASIDLADLVAEGPLALALNLEADAGGPVAPVAVEACFAATASASP